MTNIDLMGYFSIVGNVIVKTGLVANITFDKESNPLTIKLKDCYNYNLRQSEISNDQNEILSECNKYKFIVLGNQCVSTDCITVIEFIDGIPTIIHNDLPNTKAFIIENYKPIPVNTESIDETENKPKRTSKKESK